MNKHNNPFMRNTARGFTIVELLIVVVVIAILAAITVVAYNGISGRAKESALKSDLKSGATQVAVIHAETGSYPIDGTSLKKSDDITFQYAGGGSIFCLAATSSQLPGKTYYINEGGSIQEGACPPPLMQAFTGAQCQALSTFTGSNNEAIANLVDTRGGVARSYQVAKLADGKCWMLNNLKLGSTTGSITLTPADSNVASNFTLPQLITTGTESFDAPQAMGPVPGDTGAGATHYGYLYNWSAATAGETRVTKPGNSGAAVNSICPSGWHLPSGGAVGEFAMLNAKMNNPAATNPDPNNGPGYYLNWQNTGPFKGVISGNWRGSFNNQGSFGYLWSSSTFSSGDANVAFPVTFYDGAVYAGISNSDRSLGFGVRCVLN